MGVPLNTGGSIGLYRYRGSTLRLVKSPVEKVLVKGMNGLPP